MLLLAAILTALTTPSGLSLERGVYIDRDKPCDAEPTSARSWYGGSGYVIQAPHAHCVATSVHRRGRREFEVKETCRDESMPKSDYLVTERIRVLSSTEYVLRNDFGRVHARWCHE